MPVVDGNANRNVETIRFAIHITQAHSRPIRIEQRVFVECFLRGELTLTFYRRFEFRVVHCTYHQVKTDVWIQFNMKLPGKKIN